MTAAMTNANPAKIVDRSGAEIDLILYKYDACPFCVRVKLEIDRLGLPVPTRDTHRDPGAQAELVKLGGKSQVPMLMVNGRPMYESADIIRFLEQEVRLG